jgi:hypothetical protein
MKGHEERPSSPGKVPEAKENIERISPREVRQGLESGKLLLVCAYENESRCRGIQLDGAISYQGFLSRLPKLAKDQEIVFYCT